MNQKNVGNENVIVTNSHSLRAWIPPLLSQILTLRCRLLKESLVAIMIVFNGHIHGRRGSIGAKDASEETFSFWGLLLLLVLVLLLAALKKAFDVPPKLIGHDF